MNRRLVRFGEFVLDLDRAELTRGGKPVPLERQPGRVLVALVERAGSLVLRTDLHKAIWADG